MDIKEYISSGIIESYVLGVVSDQERREVECMSKIYPELQKHMLEAQGNLEELAEGWKKETPTELKKKVMVSIHTEATKEEIANTPSKKAKVIRLSKSDNARGINAKSVAAASVILVLAAAALFFMKKNDLDEAKLELTTLNEKLKVKDDQAAELNKKLDESDMRQAFITDESTLPVVLAGTTNSPEARVRAYWNNIEGKVIFTEMNLPQNQINQQYQVWAIVDGDPVDLGMLDQDNPNLSLTKKIDASYVQAFAITLENKGGSPTPNLEQLYVIGNVGT